MLSFGEGNGTPLQYSCLENPMDGGSLVATWGHRVGRDSATKPSPPPNNSLRLDIVLGIMEKLKEIYECIRV